MSGFKQASYLAVLLVILLSSTACSPTSETVTTTAQFETDASRTERYVFEYHDAILTNRSDLSTPLGTLCWAVWELARMDYLRLIDISAENTPGLEVSYSDVSSITGDGDNAIGFLGVIGSVRVIDEETARGTDAYTYLDALEEIQKPGIVGIMNNSKLSEELQLLAQAFFELVAAIESQVRAVGYESIDYTKLPYKDLDSLPHIDVLEKAAVAHPDACVFPSEKDFEEWDDNWDAQNGVTD